jgi:hypothetical protein
MPGLLHVQVTTTHLWRFLWLMIEQGVSWKDESEEECSMLREPTREVYLSVFVLWWLLRAGMRVL